MSTTDLAPTTSAPTGNWASAGARGIERRAALRGGLLGAQRPDPAGSVVVREATEADGPALRRLADVDGGRVPGAPLLIAERAGVAVAAIGVLDRRVVADPAADAAVAIDRLQAVAAERRGAERRRRWATWPRRRPAGRGPVARGGRSGAATG